MSALSRRWVAAAAAVTVAVVAGAGLAALTIAVVVARRVVTPPTIREEDVRILAIDEHRGTITLAPTAETVVPGRYGMWFERDSGYARLGTVLELTATSVTRRLESVHQGRIQGARSGRWSGWYHLSPSDLGVPFDEVTVATELGAAPAWLIPARETERSASGDDTASWVIQVHGRGVTRAETLRAIPVFRELGFTSLLISYRNDGEAPASHDGRYALGGDEWRDLESAVHVALENGARRILVMGWSMGGATTLQFVTSSPLRHHVRGIILESPVIDWVRVLHAQAATLGVPNAVRSLALGVLASERAAPWSGLSRPIDFPRLDLVERADELETPTLILHSDDDTFVPIEGSAALAAARPDTVRLERFVSARHTRLWNYDPARWERAIRTWVTALP